jgi:hypothetical protein
MIVVGRLGDVQALVAASEEGLDCVTVYAKLQELFTTTLNGNQHRNHHLNGMSWR